MPNILIVEDEPKMRRLLELNLGEEGHTIHAGGRCRRCIELFAAGESRYRVDRLEASRYERLEFLQGVNEWMPHFLSF